MILNLLAGDASSRTVEKPWEEAAAVAEIKSLLKETMEKVVTSIEEHQTVTRFLEMVMMDVEVAAQERSWC